MSMKKLIPLISTLAGMIILAGCATEGSVTVSSGYYEPYPVYVGPPVVVYHQPYYVHRYHYVRPCPPPVHHNAPPVRPHPPTHRPTPRPGVHER